MAPVWERSRQPEEDHTRWNSPFMDTTSRYLLWITVVIGSHHPIDTLRCSMGH